MRSLCLGVCLAVWGVFLGGSAQADTWYLLYGHTGEIVPVSAKNNKAFTDFGTPTEVFSSNGMTFNLFYEDVRQGLGTGFDGSNGALARQRVREVLDTVADTLNETGSLDILFKVSLTSGSSFLGRAGTYYSVAPVFQTGLAFDRLQQGSKPAPNLEEINVEMDFGFNYNFTTAPTLFGQVDFSSVLLHEFTHGLGIASLANSSGQSAIGNDAFTQWNARIGVGQGGSPIWAGSPAAFVGNAANLTSQNLFYTGTQGNALYNQGVRPPIFAPASFSSGSSISHWATGQMVGGAVMEASIASGVDRREYSPADVGALIDIGYSNAAIPGEIAPTIYISGRAQIEEGDTLSLGVVPAAFTITDYQWYKDGAPLPGEENPSFSIPAITLADSGIYRVEVTGSSKAVSTFSEPHTVTVFPLGALPLGAGIALAGLVMGIALAGATTFRKP